MVRLPDKKTIETLKNIGFVVVVLAEIIVPYVYYIGLKTVGDSPEKMMIYHHMMVILTCSISVGILAHLIYEALKG